MSSDQLNALPRGYEIQGYRMESVLGSGGFGITYRALETSIGRTVAIKEYLPAGVAIRARDLANIQPISDADVQTFEWGLDRFRHEAQTLVAFRHPNIVKVLRFFEANGTAYMVMDYEEGESLDAVLEREHTLDERVIREFLNPLIEGLTEVHSAGFLHRDIKPSNIYLRETGEPVLIDFGAARQALGLRSCSLTAIVTTGYAPHEQYESDGNQGPWTDIYALGAVLYRAVTGTIPPEATQRLSAVASGRPDPMMAASEAGLGRYSLALLDAVDGALRTFEHERPQTVPEWRSYLDGAVALPPAVRPQKVVTLEQYRPVPPRAKVKRRRLAPAAAAAVLLASGMAGAGYVAYEEYQSNQLGFQETIAKHRLEAEAARKRAAAIARKRETEAKRRASELAAFRKASEQAQKRIEEQRRLALEAARKADTAAKRAAIEARRRTAYEATRQLEDKIRRRAEAERAREIAVERRKAAATQRRLEAELKRARSERLAAEKALKRYKEATEKERKAMKQRLAKAEKAWRGAERSSRRDQRRSQARIVGAPSRPPASRKEPKRKQVASLRAVPEAREKSNRRRADESRRAGPTAPDSKHFERGRDDRRASILGPVGRPYGDGFAVRRIYGRWCSPRGALRFSGTHMTATRYDTGHTGRYELAGYANFGRRIVVRFLMPDGMHLVAFGRFSFDQQRMFEIANKRPGRPWRRRMLPWHRC